MNQTIDTPKKKIERANFILRSFEKRWDMTTPNFRCEEKQGLGVSVVGESVDLNMKQLKTILGFEGMESLQYDMWEGMKIYKYLAHETFAVTVQLIEGKISFKKKFKELKTNKMPEGMQSVFFDILRRNGNDQLKRLVDDYENNFLFETEETVQNMEKLIRYFDCLTINWIKQIEGVVKQEFEVVKKNIREMI